MCDNCQDWHGTVGIINVHSFYRTRLEEEALIECLECHEYYIDESPCDLLYYIFRKATQLELVIFKLSIE